MFTGMLRRGFAKKSQEVAPASGAPFVIVITLLIVFYIIFLPPSDREALLNQGQTPGGAPGGGVQQEGQQPRDPLLTGDGKFTGRDGQLEWTFEGPGEISEQTRDEYTHDISTFVLRGQYEGTLLATGNEFIVKRTMFNDDSHTITFSVNDLTDTRDVFMTFNVPESRGTLTISLNGAEIFNGIIDSFNSNPIFLDSPLLQPVNSLTFSVDSPGVSFWRSNNYRISDLRILGDTIDRAGLEAEDIFELRPVEIQNLESAKLRFVPECDDTNGKLTISINSQTIYSKLPDCTVTNVVPLPRSMLNIGQNTVRFESEFGQYIIDRVEVKTELDREDGPTYFFNIDERFFDKIVEERFLCGEIDGICPEDCEADLDKDCCFEDVVNGFWCDVPTPIASDRCVGNVDQFNIHRCPSGYEDDDGDVPDDFEGICGDDDDGVCPAGCSQFYDEDCCLTDDSGNFWCEDLPIGGVVNICKRSLTQDECELCPAGYEGEDKDPDNCEFRSRAIDIDEEELLEDYEVIAEFFFVNDERTHQAEVRVNDFTTSFDTREEMAIRDISRFVEDGSNYIQIIPKSDFSLVKVRIKLDER